MEDIFSDYLTFLEERPEVFQLEQCKALGVGLNCWNIRLTFTDSPEGHAWFYDLLNICRQLAGLHSEVNKDVAAGILIHECDLPHLKHLVEHLQAFNPV